jgi:hypothetical protein
MEILNQGNDPTYCSGRRLEVIDISLGPLGFLESFKSWEVSSELSLSDHRHSLFTLEVPLPVRLIRNPVGTNWETFRDGLKGVLERGPEMNIKDEAESGLAILPVQQALTSAYEKNCPLTPAMKGKHPELDIRVEVPVGRLFNKYQADITPQS